MRKRRGKLLRELDFEMLLKWGGKPAEARFTIRNTAGADLEQLTILRGEGRPPRFLYAKGDPLAAATSPNLTHPIQGTDITWLDLSLSFLWWKGGRIVDTDTVKGVACFVVDVPAPARSSAKDAQPAPAPHYARVRLWIDNKHHMLLQAEGYDAEDALVRRLWVKSFKKINDTWMIKDMEAQTYPAVHRTRVRILEVRGQPAS